MNSTAALKLLLTVTAVLLVFHFSILLKITPYEITWGGRLENDNEMYVFESISIAINTLLGFVLLLKAGYLKLEVSTKIVNAILWVFLIVFLLNTIGNLFAETILEKTFSIITLAFSVLIWIILKDKSLNSYSQS